MKFHVFGAVALLLSCAVGKAAPAPCIAGSLQSYIDLGSDGCMQGAATFTNFFDLGPLGAADAITPANVTVTPFGGTFNPGLGFAVNRSTGAGDLLELRFIYAVTASQGIFGGTTGLTGSLVTPDGANTAVADFCLAAEFVAEVCSTSQQTIIAFDIGSDSLLLERTSLAGLKTVGVMNDFVIDGGPGGAASLAGASNQFTVAPEPLTLLTTPTALLCVLWIRKRRFFLTRGKR